MSLMANTAHQLWYPTSFPSMKELEKEEVRLETQVCLFTIFNEFLCMRKV